MLDFCRRQFPGHDWMRHNMRTLNLKKCFAAVITWDSFFHLPPDDHRAMFPIFRRRAAPAAALLFTSGTEEGTSVGSMFGHEIYHASLATAEYSRLLRKHGFAVSLHRGRGPRLRRAHDMAGAPRSRRSPRDGRRG
jgi:hypothetical protein